MISISYVESPFPVYPPGVVPTLEQLNRDQPKMLDRDPRTWKKDFFKKEIPFEKMHYMVNSDYRIYSAGFFAEGISDNDHWTGQDLLILDIDDGLTLDEAKNLFSQKMCLITTTKSHQKEKNGITCDRFRIIMPTTVPITCTAKEYTATMKQILEKEFPFSDQKCKDPSRIFFGKSGAEYFYMSGKKFDFEKRLKKLQKKRNMNKGIDSQIKVFTPTPQRKAVTSHPESTQKGFYERTWCTSEMLTALKFEEKFVSGNRNNALLSWTKFFHGLGFSDSEVRQVIFWINAQGDSIAESEIERTIMRSQKIQ